MKFTKATVLLPGDQVRAILWPELGVGVVLTVSKGCNAGSLSTRVAKVAWVTGQTSTHSFAALALTEPARAGSP
jgi:hypothetical protein